MSDTKWRSCCVFTVNILLLTVDIQSSLIKDEDYVRTNIARRKSGSGNNPPFGSSNSPDSPASPGKKKPDDKSTQITLPGYLVFPKNKKRKRKLFANGDLPTKIEDDDPTDDEVNSPLTKNGITFYEQNPCKKYKENKKSLVNLGHKNGCKKAAKHLSEWAMQQPTPLPNCPVIIGGLCLQFFTRGGRCHVLVDFNGEKAYVLINKCLK